MDVEALRQSPVGRLQTITGYDPRFREDYEVEAFVPDPLPATLPLQALTYQAIVDATAMVARADQAVSLLPNPWLLARPAIRREAVATSALEGTFAALEDVLAAEFLDQGQLRPAVLEVYNYVNTADLAYKWLMDGRAVTAGFLEDLQHELVRDTPSSRTDLGQVRKAQVFIGAEGRRVADARFVPPPPGFALNEGLEHLVNWMEADSELPPVARMAIAHYQFESLHPFADGNGRLGRLLAILQLIKAGLLRAPVINLSPWLEARRQDYVDGLLRVSQTGNFDVWIRFFCEAVAAQAADAVARVEKLLELKELFAGMLRSLKAKGTSLRIADSLIGYPMFTVRAMEVQLGVSYQAANQAVGRLVEAGIVQKASRGNYDRLFSCPAVLRVIEN